MRAVTHTRTEQGGTGIRKQEKDASSYPRAVAVFLLLGSCLRAKLDWVLDGEEELGPSLGPSLPHLIPFCCFSPSVKD